MLVIASSKPESGAEHMKANGVVTSDAVGDVAGPAPVCAEHPTAPPTIATNSIVDEMKRPLNCPFI